MVIIHSNLYRDLVVARDRGLGLSGVVRLRVRVPYPRDFVNVIELGSTVVLINRRFANYYMLPSSARVLYVIVKKNVE